MRQHRILLIEEKNAILTNVKAEFDLYLSKLFPVHLIRSYDIYMQTESFDLLIYEKNIYDITQLEKAIQAILQKLPQFGAEMTPIIFLSQADPSQWANLHKSTALPWLFDLLHPAHIKSLPIRVANLLRMREQLLQLKMHTALMKSLNERVQLIEETLKKRQ